MANDKHKPIMFLDEDKQERQRMRYATYLITILIIGYMLLSYDSWILKGFEDKTVSVLGFFASMLIILWSILSLVEGNSYITIAIDTEGLIITYGTGRLHSLIIAKNDIVKIGASPLSILKYFSKRPILRYFTVNKDGWVGILGWNRAGTLAIVTKSGKYLISCYKAESAAKTIQEVYGIQEELVELPISVSRQ
jgi:hypothetical protein